MKMYPSTRTIFLTSLTWIHLQNVNKFGILSSTMSTTQISPLHLNGLQLVALLYLGLHHHLITSRSLRNQNHLPDQFPLQRDGSYQQVGVNKTNKKRTTSRLCRKMRSILGTSQLQSSRMNRRSFENETDSLPKVQLRANPNLLLLFQVRC